MILANRNGTLIAVTFVREHRGNTIVQEIGDGSVFTLKPEEVNRKLFDGANAVDDATAWVLECRKTKRGAQLAG